MSTVSEDVFDPIERAVDALADGQLVIVTDDEGRENEGDLVLAASKVTTERINFMIRHARGLICVPMLDQRLKRLGIDDMVPSNRESFRTAFTVSVDAAHGVTTGISAYDRALTVRALASPDSTPSDLVQPGHIFPLRARPGGVLERAGHTEASIDLVTMAGLEPCAVICEILNEDGSMARLDELARFKQAHNLPMISVAQLIKRRHKHERLVDRVESRPLATEFGEFTLHVYQSRADKRTHAVLVMGELGPAPALVRVQSQNVLQDVFRARGGHGFAAVEGGLRRIAEEGRGAFVYIDGEPMMEEPATARSEGERALAAADRQLRQYGIGAQILADLGLRKIRLLTSSRKRLVALQSYGLEIVEHVDFAG